ncbi:MAG: hypothetical protein GY834_02250 [Bacteroidetes bacterium]|nr:hypothetical protein [Bacteroidota bacterium]
MSYEPWNEEKTEKTEEGLLSYAEHYNQLNKYIKDLQKDLKTHREKILGRMEELGVRKLSNEAINIEIRVRDNFDVQWFTSKRNKDGDPEWSDYVVREEITTVTYTMDKKAVARLKKQEPDLYKLHCDEKESLYIK